MTGVIGALFGFLQPLTLPILDFFRERRDQKHELALMDQQMKMQEALAKIDLAKADKRLEETLLTGASAEMVQRLKSDQVPTGTWIDGLRASVRPTLSYLIFIMWAAVKLCRYLLLTDAGDSAAQAVVNLWGPEDWELMMYVITFWFGDRTRERWMASRAA